MSIITRICIILLPVIILVVTGYGYALLRREQAQADMAVVNRLSMQLFSPLLVYTALAGKDFDLIHNSTLILAGIVIALGSGLLAWPVARMFGYDVRSFLPPMMFNNCGNLGLPLAVMAFGQAEFPAAVALFAACTLVYFTVGIFIIESAKGWGRFPTLKFLANPIIAAMVAGFICSACRFTLPDPFYQALKMLGDISIPLMLFSLGVRMINVSLRSWQIGLVGAIACPTAGLVMAGILDTLVSLTATQRGQMYLFASLPPAVFCFVIAEHYRQEPDKVAAIVLLGNLAALVFVPIGLGLGLSR